MLAQGRRAAPAQESRRGGRLVFRLRTLASQIRNSSSADGDESTSMSGIFFFLYPYLFHEQLF